jgi:hypothetical protein
MAEAPAIVKDSDLDEDLGRGNGFKKTKAPASEPGLFHVLAFQKIRTFSVAR